MNEDIERLKDVIYKLMGENRGLRFVAGVPEKNYELRGCELYCGNEPCHNSNEKNSGCIILDIRTGKRVV